MPKALDQSIILNLINFISNNEIKKNCYAGIFIQQNGSEKWIKYITDWLFRIFSM